MQRPPAAFSRTIQLDSDVTADSLVKLSYIGDVAERQLGFTRKLTFPAPIPPEDLLPEGFRVVRRHQGRSYATVHAVCDQAALLIETEPGETVIGAAAGELEDLELLIKQLPERAEAHLTRAADEVDIHLWREYRDGGTYRRQRITTAAWEQIEGNYPAGLVGQLARLMGLTRPDSSARLLLWHGEPGTGKTRAVMALLRAWRGWCEAHVVADPENAFSNPNYLLEVLEEEASLRRYEAGGDDDYQPHWKLVVCEDADEFLRSDARARSGPALGRLLNATDGILGQGTRTLVLLTTNDQVGRLHPAVTRPGRCLMVSEFRRFDVDEAARWLGDGFARPTDPMTLAELYAVRGGGALQDLPAQPNRLGQYL